MIHRLKIMSPFVHLGVCVVVTRKESSLVFMPFLFASVMGVKFIWLRKKYYNMCIGEKITLKAIQELAMKCL